jgi:hypothetical protein
LISPHYAFSIFRFSPHCRFASSLALSPRSSLRFSAIRFIAAADYFRHAIHFAITPLFSFFRASLIDATFSFAIDYASLIFSTIFAAISRFFSLRCFIYAAASSFSPF